MRPFRSISAYKINVPSNESDIVRIIKAVSQHSFIGCNERETLHYGFEPWEDEGERLWIKAEESGVACRLKIETKKAPASLVSRVLKEEIHALEQSGGRILSAEEKLNLRSSIYEKLSCKALPSYKEIQILFNERQGFLWIDTINAQRQEQALDLFGKIFPNTTVTPDLVSPNLPIRFKELVTSKNPKLPFNFRFSGDTRVHINNLGSRNGTLPELRKLISDDNFSVPYISVIAGPIVFRWHNDGSISHIENHGGGKPSIRSSLGATNAIAQWINTNPEFQK